MNISQNCSDSGYFETSEIRTPSFHNDTPVNQINRKRKAPGKERCRQNLSKILDFDTPTSSSTFNDSLKKNLEKIQLQNAKMKEIDSRPQTAEFHGNNDSRRFCSVPNTPEHQVKYSKDSITKANTSSFIKKFSQFGVQSQSPLKKEKYEILYPELPSLEAKKPSTPRKNRTNLQAKRKLFYKPAKSNENLLKKIISNHVIMTKILKDLSNGDLYRLAQVSVGFNEAILRDIKAGERLQKYLLFHKQDKENYSITPPASPDKSGSDSDVEASPRSKNFNSFIKVGKYLTENQSLIKCPKCLKPSILENEIAQCQNVNMCGYIFCRKCDSFASDPNAFVDKCQNAQLLNGTWNRSKLEGVSNSTMTSDYMTDISNTIFSSSFTLNLSERRDSSGMFSECEVSTPIQKVKRNLTKSFMPSSKVKIFASSNARVVTTSQSKRMTRQASLVPVVPAVPNMGSEMTEPSSPTRVHEFSACSKQSRRNLKRLTR